MDFEADLFLPERFRRGLAVAPQGTALKAGPVRLTYQELDRLARSWAAELHERGARRVGVLAGKGLTGYAGVLAAMYAGATVVPLRPDFPAVRLTQMIEAAQVDVLLVDDEEHLATTVPRLTPDRIGRRDFEPVAVGADDIAYILFTSGSTGRPKGVRLSHRNLAHYFGLLDKRYRFSAEDVFSQTFDLNFDCAIFDLFNAWGAGATVVAIPPAAYRDLPRYLAEAGVTVWFSTPSAIGTIRRTGGLGPAALPGLRHSFFAGEALAESDTSEWQQAAPGSIIENLYGPTELTVTIAAYRWHGPSGTANGVVPIGAVHSSHHSLVLDGELCISGPQLTPGYLDPADEEGRFVWHEGRRYYRTGDRVQVLPGGDLAYRGRLDSQVQVHGWRVELSEVEHALRGCGLNEAVAIGVERGGSTEIFVFYTGEPVAVPQLVRRLREELPAGVVPRHFRRLAELPLNANRKTDRLRLRDLAAEL